MSGCFPWPALTRSNFGGIFPLRLPSAPALLSGIRSHSSVSEQGQACSVKATLGICEGPDGFQASCSKLIIKRVSAVSQLQGDHTTPPLNLKICVRNLCVFVQLSVGDSPVFHINIYSVFRDLNRPESCLCTDQPLSLFVCLCIPHLEVISSFLFSFFCCLNLLFLVYTQTLARASAPAEAMQALEGWKATSQMASSLFLR